MFCGRTAGEIDQSVYDVCNANKQIIEINVFLLQLVVRYIGLEVIQMDLFGCRFFFSDQCHLTHNFVLLFINQDRINEINWPLIYIHNRDFDVEQIN